MGKNRVFMKLSQFKFPFRADLIAKEPTRFRDDCKLMVMRRQSGKIENKIFKWNGYDFDFPK